MANLLPIVATANANSTSAMLLSVLPFALILVLMYFIMIRPQKKKEKKDIEMRKNLQIGDEIVSAGGIVGIVFAVKEDSVVIETGADRSKIILKKWAIAQNKTIHE